MLIIIFYHKEMEMNQNVHVMIITKHVQIYMSVNIIPWASGLYLGHSHVQLSNSQQPQDWHYLKIENNNNKNHK